jgi:hypothetical protein
MLKKLIPICGLFLVLQSCDKHEDDSTAEVNYTGSPSVGFNNYYDDDGVQGYIKKAFEIKDTLVSVGVEVKLENTTAPADKDIKVYFKKVDALVTDYNPAYTPVPASSAALIYDFSQPAIIQKGQRKVTVPVKINTSKLSLSATNALGIAIAKVEGAELSAGKSTQLVIEFGSQNPYDGYYQTKGAAFHPSYGDYTWNSVGVYDCGAGFALITSGAYSVDLDPGQPLMNAGTLTYFSAVVPRFTVDPVTNKVTITTTNTTVFDQYPAYNSRYDPATRTFYVKYGWSGTRVATDTFTYCGPR